jgi:hypothetical protein
MRTAKVGKRGKVGTIKTAAVELSGAAMAGVKVPAENGIVGYKRPPVATQFKPGNLANPGGKPVKSRNRLQGDFVRRLADDFERYGIYAIARARHYDPLGYLRVCASLMPKEVELMQPLGDISDEQLDAAIIAVRAILAAQGDGTGPIGMAAGGVVRP